MAVPVASGGRVLGAVRITFPTDEIDADIRRYWLLLAGVTLVGIAAVGAIGLVLARTMTNPLQRLRQSAVSLGRGELSTRVGEGPGPREVQDLATSFDAMAGRLERLVASQRDFAADASHQLRTPLAALRLRLENLRDGDGDGRRDIDAALVEVERLSGIIDGLLVLARAEFDRAAPRRDRRGRGGRRPGRGPRGAGRPAGRDAGLRRRAGQGDGGARRRGPDARQPHRQRRQGLSPRLTVTVRAARADGRVEVHVIDQGPGLSDEERRHAFDRFWRSGATGRGGSGLGLAIVDRLATASGGTAELRPADGGRHRRGHHPPHAARALPQPLPPSSRHRSVTPGRRAGSGARQPSIAPARAAGSRRRARTGGAARSGSASSSNGMAPVAAS